MLEKLNPTEAKAYFEDYYEREKNIYRQLLADNNPVLKGTVAELAEKYEMKPDQFAGFIDGANTSLEQSINLDEVEADTEVELNFNWEKLYFNMHKAKADWLYELPEWDEILTIERRAEIYKEYKQSLQVHVEHVGRNDPCPCGSGKKYKNCCGKNN